MEKEEILILVILIITIILFILFSGLWSWAVNNDLKAPTVIRDNPPSIRSVNPPNNSLSSTEKSPNQPSSGYNVSNLGQPCVSNISKEGTPNLPASYLLNECGVGQECRSDVYNGSICQSKIGFFCLTKSDCVSEANDCLNNICVSDENKLNTICIDDSDCQTEINPNNLSCIQTSEQGNIKRCKINNYPLAYGCQSLLDCSGFNQNNIVECVSDVNLDTVGNYDMSATYNSGTFTFSEDDENLLYPLINSFINANNSYTGGGKIVLIIDGNESYLYQVGNFNPSDYTFTPIPYVSRDYTTPLNFTNKSYTIRMLSSLNSGENFCVSKVPTGGKIGAIQNDNLKSLLNNIEKPCSGNDVKTTFGNDVYCLPSTFKLGQTSSFCDTSATEEYPKSLSCNVGGNLLNVSGVEQKLTCLYDESLDLTLGNNFNYINTTAYKTIGRCLYPLSTRGESCNNISQGCSIPYVCLDDGNRRVCLDKLDTQTCYFNDYCPDGFVCQGSSCVPQTGEICIGDGCNQTLNIWRYTPPDASVTSDTTSGKYESVYTIGQGDPNNWEIIIGKNYVTSNGKDEISKIVLYDTVNAALYTLRWNENSYVQSGAYYLKFSGVQYHKIILDNDDRVIIFYRKELETCRKRSYKIASVSVPDSTITLENISNIYPYDGSFPGNSVGAIVSYEGTSYIGVNEESLYYFDVDASDTSGASKIGSLINFNNGGTEGVSSTIVGGYITTYDPHVYFAQNTDGVSWESGIGYCENSDGKYPWVLNGDRFNLIEGGVSIVSLTNGLPYSQEITNGKEFFFTQQSSYESLSYAYYTITDDYNSSEGTAPFNSNQKYINQKFIYRESKNLYKLYAGMSTYGIHLLDENTPNTNVGISPSDIYVNNGSGTSYRINGLPTSTLTYAFESDSQFKIETYKKDGQNYFIFHTRIPYMNKEQDGVSTKYINYAQRVSYDIGDNNEEYDYQYKPKEGTSWINFSYLNNAVVPYGRNFFNDENNTLSINTYNNVQSVQNNSFVIQDNDDFNIIASYFDNDSNPQKNSSGEKINITSNSQFRKYENNFTNSEYPIDGTFEGVNDIFTIAPLELEGGLVQINSATGDQNTFEELQNIITFNNQNDIDIILKYSSSEIAIVKEAALKNIKSDIYNYDGISAFYPFEDSIPLWLGTVNEHSFSDVTINQNGKPSVILIITDIIEHNITLNNEYLRCKINRPINYGVSLTGGDYQFDSYIIDQTDEKWKFYLYNYIPLAQQTFSTDENEYINRIFDSTPLYTSTKDNDFFTNSQYNRTSYNKILYTTDENTISVQSFFDGYGVSYSPTVFSKISVPIVISDDQNTYDTNYWVSNRTSAVYGDPTGSGSYFNYLDNINEPTTIADLYLPFNVFISAIFSLPRLGNPSLIYNAMFFPLGDISLYYLLVGCVFASNFPGKSFYIGLSDDEKTLMTTLTNGYIGSNSAADIYNTFEQTYVLGGRTIAIRDLIIGPRLSATASIFNYNLNDFYSTRFPLYAINNLFLSTLTYANNLGGAFLKVNNNNYPNTFIISNKDGSNRYKPKGAYKLNLDSYPIVVKKGNGDGFSTLDQTNIETIDFPTWINELSTNNQFPHKILNVIYNPGEENVNNGATYYVYTSYENELGVTKYQMYYFSAFPDIFNDSGVPLSNPSNSYYSISSNGNNEKNNLKQDSRNKYLFLLGNEKKS